MARVFKGRYTAEIDESFLVFLIGMRVNNLWAFHKWVPTAAAMVPMLKTLFAHPEKGFLGGQIFVYWRGVGVIQYWRSFDDLEHFARHPSEPHLAAWKRFNRSVGSDGSVGIWHETFLVPAKQYESMYGNMPVFGLARATKHVPAIGNRETARLRLGGRNEPATPSPPTPVGQ